MPTSNMSYVEVAVSDSAAVSLTKPDFGWRALVQPSTPVRFRIDDTAPTNSVGFRVPTDSVVELKEDEIVYSKWITESGSGVLRIFYYND